MYALLTRAPLSTGRTPYTVRLACIKPAASVHPEPGSNSPWSRALRAIFDVLASLFPIPRLATKDPSLPFSPAVSMNFPVSSNDTKATLLNLSLHPSVQLSSRPNKLRFSIFSAPLSKRGCKSTTVFLSSKLFLKFFSKKFRRPSIIRLSHLHFLRSGTQRYWPFPLFQYQNQLFLRFF